MMTPDEETSAVEEKACAAENGLQKPEMRLLQPKMKVISLRTRSALVLVEIFLSC